MADSTTIRATLNTVRVVLLMKARSTTNCRTVSTVLMLSHSCHVVGQLKSRFDGFLDGLGRGDQDEGERDQEDHDRGEDRHDAGHPADHAFAPHEFLSLRPRKMLIGTMMAATIRNRITLPAVDRP